MVRVYGISCIRYGTVRRERRGVDFTLHTPTKVRYCTAEQNTQDSAQDRSPVVLVAGMDARRPVIVAVFIASLAQPASPYALAPISSASSSQVKVQHRPHSAIARQRTQPLLLGDNSRDQSPIFSALKDAWSRFVLLRPGMSMDELRDSTRFRTAKSWSWKQRTPGTARTIIISVFVISVFAIPALVVNPAIFSYLLEFAALSREGISPAEVIQDIFGERPAF